MPIINREGSDSAILDNVLEFLVMNGRPLTRAASMLLPEPWDHNDSLSEERGAYDAYQSMLMEPWVAGGHRLYRRSHAGCRPRP